MSQRFFSANTIIREYPLANAMSTSMGSRGHAKLFDRGPKGPVDVARKEGTLGSGVWSQIPLSVLATREGCLSGQVDKNMGLD